MQASVHGPMGRLTRQQWNQPATVLVPRRRLPAKALLVWYSVSEFFCSYGYSPSQREIGRHCRLAVGTVADHLTRLEALDLLWLQINVPRSISLRLASPVWIVQAQDRYRLWQETRAAGGDQDPELPYVSISEVAQRARRRSDARG